MNLLPHQLRPCLARRVCLVGLGNPRLGDDAVGVRIAEALTRERLNSSLPLNEDSASKPCDPRTRPAAGEPAFPVILHPAGDPDEVIPRIVEGRFDHVVFIEALDFGGRPGSVTVLQTEEIRSRFSRPGCLWIPLGPLVERIESNGHTKAWVLGVQPASLRPDRPLSRSVQGTFQKLVELLAREIGIPGAASPSPA
ncbi:MAG: hypothetical protein AB7O66_07825 [Limisphaerales bacterium]